MRAIASWNVNSIRARLGHVQRWLREAAPDVLALQETKVEDTGFPAVEFAQSGYVLTLAGQRTYNGVAVLSRDPPQSVVTDNPHFPDPQRRILGVEFSDLFVLNVYVPNGAEIGGDKYAYKLAWLAGLREWLRELLATHTHLAVIGDFNIAPDDRDVYDPAALREQILCSAAERRAFQQILELGLHDTFRLHETGPGHYSWWDYRAGAFRRNHGLRIDLILTSPQLTARCCAAGIARDPRTWDRPSDHAPIVAEFVAG